MSKITKRIKKASNELFDYFSRMGARLSQISQQFEVIENKTTLTNSKLEKVIPLLNNQLKSYPDLLRVIDELHGYVMESGEELSQIHSSLQEAQHEIKQLSELSQKGRHNVANVQTVAQEGLLFVESDPDTFERILMEVDMPMAQSVLERLPEPYWDRWQAVMQEVSKNRRIL